VPTIDLRIGEMLQGEFEPGRLNVLLAFQVNCPGCFIHGLPLASSLHERYQHSDVRVLGLSTVFEDFSLNTAAHTRELLQGGRLVGETATHFLSKGAECYDQSIPFAVAMDDIGPNGVGQTFAINRFPGTPTWVVFDGEYRIHDRWFGHRDEANVTHLVDDALEALPITIS
jgi:hypothetical protein